MHPITAAISFGALLGTLAQAAPTPTFAAYGVTEKLITRPPKVQIKTDEDKMFVTRLKEGAKQKPNFAGHFVLTSWGCGASCLTTAAINAKTGEVTWLPFTVCCWDMDVKEPLEFNGNSRLLIVHGSRNEAGAGTYYYVFDGHQFTLVSSKENPAK